MTRSEVPAGREGASSQPAMRPAKRRSNRWIVGSAAAVVTVALVAAIVVYVGHKATDSDGDGLPDRVELAGWTTRDGVTYVTDPNAADTDGDGLSDAEEAGAVVSDAGKATRYAGVSDPTKADSDGDGLDDRIELAGWSTASKVVYTTEPMNPDTDGDGLADGEEAGAAIDSAASTPVYAAVSDPTKVDSDGDGLRDRAEFVGWPTVRGAVYRTDPMRSDTDGDGLTDAEEAAYKVRRADGHVAFTAFSNPLVADTDGDELTDLDEADLSLDAFNSDTDGDELNDYREVEVFGTDPDVADTDSDGLDDGYEVANAESQGLDPLWADEKVDPSTYAWEFAQGAIVGEIAPGSTLPWLAGNIASSGASFIPVVGTALGTVADVRDTVGSAIHADWVGAGLSAASLVPYVGDTGAVVGKVRKFVDRSPGLAVAAGASVVALKWIPTRVKVSTVRLINKKADDLADAGVTDETLVTLQMGKNSIDGLADAMKRPGHVKVADERPRAGFFATGKEGEDFLAEYLGVRKAGDQAQVVKSTSECAEVCNSSTRRFDFLVDGIGHESKVGRASLTEPNRRQIESDAYFIENGTIEGAVWHFFASDVTKKMGPTKQLLDFLDEKGIPYTIHLPS